ncbi:AAA domain-containing protein [Jimgerdemannia flammicorona]|uniref:AAA domain-containing protein n=1 Tax=Jimgerdemannia flammicorona TaxID=994334 RepID=A0A433DFH5_9FUNG|nr:AAA domain-containing protein [Jimgerdemannia flammicorona]
MTAAILRCMQIRHIKPLSSPPLRLYSCKVMDPNSVVATNPPEGTTAPTHEAPKPRMLVLVGFPGSGKSTFSKQLCQIRSEWRRVNQDDMGDRQTCEEYARTYLGKHTLALPTTPNIPNHLAPSDPITTTTTQGFNVVVDRCNFDFAQRKVWVQLAWRLDTAVDCLVFDTEEAECGARIRARQDHPTGVLGAKGVEILSRFVGNFRSPKQDEGFERITWVNPRPTPVYDEQAINEVFAELDAQPLVSHQRRVEPAGGRGGYRGRGRGGHRGGHVATVGNLPSSGPPPSSGPTQNGASSHGN